MPRPILAALLALCATGAAHAQTRELSAGGELLDRIAAIVNDGVVLKSELDEQMQLISSRLRQQGLELPPENVLRQQVLERLVTQEVQMQRASRAGRRAAQRHSALAAAAGAREPGHRLRELP